MQCPADAGQARPGHLLHDDSAVAEVRAYAAVFFRHGRAEETKFAGLLPELPADLAIFLPLFMVGRRFLLQKLADGIPEAVKVGVKDCAWNHGVPR